MIHEITKRHDLGSTHLMCFRGSSYYPYEASVRRDSFVVPFPHCFCFARNARRILLVPTRNARRVRANSNSIDHPLEGKITKRVGLDELTNLLNRHLRGNQIRLVWRIDSVIARANRRWATDA